MHLTQNMLVLRCSTFCTSTHKLVHFLTTLILQKKVFSVDKPFSARLLIQQNTEAMKMRQLSYINDTRISRRTGRLDKKSDGAEYLA